MGACVRAWVEAMRIPSSVKDRMHDKQASSTSES